jgi:DNA-binding CsgD family transcriptional regulator
MSVAPQPVSRATEADAVSHFLKVCRKEPASLLFEGEAGIGKTTLWHAAVRQARTRGMHVLTARAAATESVTAYISLADLFSAVEHEILSALPEPQRLAAERVLLQVSDDGLATDQRAVAAAFLSAIKILSDSAPVLVAIDDLQWLDASSARVVSFAVRRFAGPVGLLATVRTGDGDDGVSWLPLEHLDAVTRIRLGPMTIGGLHEVVSARLGRSISRQAMLRIHEASGGNPFYAIELARTMTDREFGIEMTLPTTLAGLVASRIGVLDANIREALLAAACLAAPTVELVSRAIGGDGVEDCVQRLLAAESQGIVTIDRNRLRFTHPLLAAGVYTDATSTQRRAMHNRLASLVDHPELRARHLALAATHADEATVDALDAAAALASRRGAPAAAAEFMELADELGAIGGERQIRCATYHFNAGDAARARHILETIVSAPASARVHAEALGLLGLWNLLDGSSRDAANLLERAAAVVAEDQKLLAQILVALSFARLNIHAFGDAARAADEAVAAATRSHESQLLSQALAMRVTVHFLVGDGFDEEDMQTALRLDDAPDPPSALVWPTAQRAVLLIGIGRLDDGRRELRAIRQRYIERGAESELMIGAFHSALVEIWRGDFAAASLIGEDAMQRARQLGGDLPMSVALMIQATVAAYGGDEHAARRDAVEALAGMRRCDSPALVTVWPTATLGFLEVSLGRYQAAFDVLEPLLAAVDRAPRATEIYVAPFLPDAAEALIQLGRLDEAQRLIELLEGNGHRLNRPWMLALGARCDAMLLAARHDVGPALEAAHRAMAEHDRLSMPFERARSQMLLGELQRRQRGRGNAAAPLREAVATFEVLNTPLWATRARIALDRIHFGRTDAMTLTSAERRIADLAAAGTTNRDIAGSLFISPKTVEVHLSRIYRKLGIRSRAELGRRLDQLGDVEDS